MSSGERGGRRGEGAQAAASAKRNEGRASLLAQWMSVCLATHRVRGPCLVWGDPRAGEQLRPGATATELSLGPGAQEPRPLSTVL